MISSSTHPGFGCTSVDCSWDAAFVVLLRCSFCIGSSTGASSLGNSSILIIPPLVDTAGSESNHTAGERCTQWMCVNVHLHTHSPVFGTCKKSPSLEILAFLAFPRVPDLQNAFVRAREGHHFAGTHMLGSLSQGKAIACACTADAYANQVPTQIGRRKAAWP